MRKLIPEFHVADVTATARFWVDLLEFELVQMTGAGGSTRAWLRRGAVEVIFVARFEGMARELPRLLSPEALACLRPTLHLEVEDARALYDRLAGNCEIVTGLQRSVFGTEEFTVRDPGGLVLHVSQAEPVRVGRTATGRTVR